MMKLALLSAILGSAAAFAPAAPVGRASSTTTISETKADLQSLAQKLNPAVKYFDPLNLAGAEFWGTSNESTIGFLRESEVKHGRVAMFAFVGYIVHANGITWPWAMTLAGDPFPKVASAPEAWDAIPEAAKWQIIMFVGFLEFVSFAEYYDSFVRRVRESFACRYFFSPPRRSCLITNTEYIHEKRILPYVSVGVNFLKVAREPIRNSLHERG
jgi:hypothetical protein